jgi:hypothetical protein
MLNLYRGLLGLRRRVAPLRLGTYRPLADMPEQVYGYAREYQAETVITLLNFSDEACDVTLGDGEHMVLLSTHLDRAGPETSRLTLRPNEGVVVGAPGSTPASETTD